MVTLQSYLLRELLKTFALALAAMTGLLTMAGSLFSVLKFEGLTPANLLRVMPLLLPMFAAMTMPVAAIFSATMAYGRMAADNEFTACRAAGINVHRLFLPAVLLSIFAAAFSAVAGNYLVPESYRQIQSFARKNLRDIAYEQLRSKGRIRVKERHFMTAEGVEIVKDAALRERGFPVGSQWEYMWIVRPTYLELDGAGEIVRFTAAEGGLCQFDRRGGEAYVTVFVQNARNFEFGRERSSVFVAQQKIGPAHIPREGVRKPSLVDLNTLLDWRLAPWAADSVRPKLDMARAGLLREMTLSFAQSRLRDGVALNLVDDRGFEYAVRGEGLREVGGPLVLRGIHVSYARPGLARPTEYDAPQGSLEVIPSAGADGPPATLTLKLSRSADAVVRIRERLSDAPESTRETDEEFLIGLSVPREALDAWAKIGPATIADPGAPLPLLDELANVREGVFAETTKVAGQIRGVLHWRFATAASALVTVIMGAALGVIFRGAHALAAFALACIPFGGATILINLARGITEKTGGEVLGPSLSWGSLGAILLVNLLILRFGVRR